MRAPRKCHREPADFPVTLFWEDASGKPSNVHPRTLDTSQGGICLECPREITPGTRVYMHAARCGFPQEAVVRYSVERGGLFRIGFEFSDPSRMADPGTAVHTDYYEVLQLSSKADFETIERVYRIMAKRFHPDNTESGDQERFLLLSEAHRVLSDPHTRASYDRVRQAETPRPLPTFQTRAFVDEKEGEVNRRLGVLCLLYSQRRRDPEHPSISMLELEELMAIPREYLEFTLWYLKAKKYLEMNDGADFSLTADGVDFVEEHAPAHALIRKLLQDAGGMPATGPAMAPAVFGDVASVQ